MADFEIKVENADKLARAMQSYPAVAEPILQKAIVASQFVFQKHTLRNDPVPWRTGALLQSFRFFQGRLEARWSPTASYAAAVEFGTRPHEIRPVRARVLSWISGGQGRYVTAASGRRRYQSSPGARVFASRVKHPGTKPKPFMKRIVENSEADVGRLFAEAGDLITARLAGDIGRA